MGSWELLLISRERIVLVIRLVVVSLDLSMFPCFNNQPLASLYGHAVPQASHSGANYPKS